MENNNDNPELMVRINLKLHNKPLDQRLSFILECIYEDLGEKDKKFMDELPTLST